ncbi:hypothetical protein T265_11378 [Opisthorchis viverrini]|uniref:Uncharacterized protein n=1 Tax=Opisthorchis viverrini TaxID=6198 RepID=A0A074Z378_OPIVI|nr:hypothetical protein T265_11378 [Opisthorchis viverrini]KER19977.1 hypothetical protein T265_11378 [Opisthorchis viverrini]
MKRSCRVPKSRQKTTFQYLHAQAGILRKAKSMILAVQETGTVVLQTNGNVLPCEPHHCMTETNPNNKSWDMPKTLQLDMSGGHALRINGKSIRLDECTV